MKMNRTETATSIVIAAFVFVRKAQAQGGGNMITKLMFAEIATMRGISGDDFSIATCVRIAKRRAREVGESYLLDL